MDSCGILCNDATGGFSLAFTFPNCFIIGFNYYFVFKLIYQVGNACGSVMKPLPQVPGPLLNSKASNSYGSLEEQNNGNTCSINC